MDTQKSLFNQEEKSLSQANKIAVLESLAALAELGTKEKVPHVRTAMKEYFDQLRMLVGSINDDSDTTI